MHICCATGSITILTQLCLRQMLGKVWLALHQYYGMRIHFANVREERAGQGKQALLDKQFYLTQNGNGLGIGQLTTLLDRSIDAVFDSYNSIFCLSIGNAGKNFGKGVTRNYLDIFCNELPGGNIMKRGSLAL